MATVAQTMKGCLLDYPVINPCPLAVSIHWFAVAGTGYYWNRNGELVCGYEGRNRTEMDFSDLNAHQEDITRRMAEDDGGVLAQLNNERLLEIAADRMTRGFIADNIDTICASRVTMRLFDYRPSSSYYTEHLDTQVNAIAFPDNITKDWARAVNDFISEWHVALNQAYGVQDKKGDEAIAHWPEHVKAFREALHKAHDRLIPVLYDKTAEEFKAQQNKVIGQLLEMLGKHS